jgi:thymidylate synthase
MKNYLETLQHILNNGTERGDRTGTGTLSVFGMQHRYDLSKGFPAVTTKKLAWKAMVGELLWFIEGGSSERRLAEITHGTSEGTTTIWTPNALAPYWKPKAKFEGDLGRVYGVQWRHWRGVKPMHHPEMAASFNVTNEVDQLADLIAGIKSDPNGRRHILSAWKVDELDQMALPPCHVMSQFYVSNNRLSCHMYQRSQDVYLGAPFNIASYALLTHMIAQVCGFQVGELIISTGDTHIYTNHLTQVKELLSRTPLPAPTLWLNPDVKDIEKFTMNDIKLLNYQSYSALPAPMAV